jgi:hypothetical protein
LSPHPSEERRGSSSSSSSPSSPSFIIVELVAVGRSCCASSLRLCGGRGHLPRRGCGRASGDHKAHIPQQRGGAPGRVAVCGWAWVGMVSGGWLWWKNEGGRTKINRDVVDGGLKLRSPSKIAFDMSVSLFDSKIKNWSIL